MPRLPASVLERLLRVDGWNQVAVGAEAATHGFGAEEPFGIARFIRLSERPDTAEAAVAVVDHVQRRGLGKLLLSVLAAAARERGITKFRAEVLRSNEAVKALLQALDETLQPVSADGGIAVYEVNLLDVGARE
jgi:GNAT superfamily N-acetyltransferase